MPTQQEYSKNAAPTDTVSYTYGDSNWGDKLTAYDGVAITYDEIGNPLTYGDKTFAWEHGRELATLSDGTTTWTYTYDSNGMRTKRTDGTNTFSYVYNGSQLSYMSHNSDTLYFTYDAAGTPITVNYNGTLYYYITNLQGDVIKIIGADRSIQVYYAYDAWGNVLSCTGSMADILGAINPLRYRGYVYDQETGLYYVSSRYYDPEIGRFINSDIFPSTGQGVLGNNMFAYCGNNPVSRVDVSGYFWETVFDVVSLAASIVEVCVNPCDAWAWAGLALDIVDVAVPFVGGLGEVSDVVNATRKAADAADNLRDASKVAENAQDLTKLNRTVVEVKLPTQAKMSDATELWDEFLGPNQTSYNKFKGSYDPDRIFSADGNRSIRFGVHEMNSLGTKMAHFHYEEWFYGLDSDDVIIFNQLQRLIKGKG